MNSLRVALVVLVCSLAFTTSATVRYVDVGSSSPAPPYTNWATAAITIQDAVDACVDGDEVLVTNGIYETGGRAVGNLMTNRVAVTGAVSIVSVGGPVLTVIRGYGVPGSTNGDGAIRCVYLTNGARLSGFTIRDGATRTTGDAFREQSGGGIWCATNTAVISNCVVVANSGNWYGGGVYGGTLDSCIVVSNLARYGGGVSYAALNRCQLAANRAVNEGGGGYFSTLNNCTVMGNLAQLSGGGCYDGTLINCTLANNTAALNSGGGIYAGRLTNCIVYFNSAGLSGTNYSGSVQSFCCTTPAAAGTGNISVDPGLVDLAGGNLRLQATSPCINSGHNTPAAGTLDLDGNQRIVAGTVDIGAYEFPSPASTLSYAWAQHFGIPLNGLADHADADGDGMDNWQEWRAGTDPTNPLSVLKLLPLTIGTDSLAVTWESVSGIGYSLERASDLTTFSTIASNLTGQAALTTYIDTSASGDGPFFYRVRVEY